MHKALEAKVQDKTFAEFSADREAANAELSAVLDHFEIRDQEIGHASVEYIAMLRQTVPAIPRR